MVFCAVHVFPLICRISCLQSLLRWKSCHHLLKNALVMLKTSDSQFGPVLMLFYAALFLLLHGTTAWSEVREVKVYEQTSGPNWSQHVHRESEWVLSDWERSWSSGFICLYLHLTFCPMSQPVPSPMPLQFWCHLSEPGPDLTLAACHVMSIRGLPLPLCSNFCVFFPLTPFSHSSEGLPLLASSSHAQTPFSSLTLRFCWISVFNVWFTFLHIWKAHSRIGIMSDF